MSLRVGDTVFLPRGDTAVVTEHDPSTSAFKISSDPALSKEVHRYGYINGMNPEQRLNLTTLMDRVREIDDPKERVGELKQKLDELRNDPRQWQMARYVESEMAHMMNIFNIKPTTYSSEMGLIKDGK